MLCIYNIQTSRNSVDLSTMDDDDFGEGSDIDMQQADLRKIADKLGKDGYRIGKAKEEEMQMQLGFDKGFERGLKLGKACGKLYGSCLAKVPTDNNEATKLMSQLQKLLYETVPEAEELDEALLNVIYDLVNSLPVDLAVPLAMFKEATFH